MSHATVIRQTPVERPPEPMKPRQEAAAPIVERCKPFDAAPKVNLGEFIHSCQSHSMMLGALETITVTLPGTTPLILYNLVVNDTLGKLDHYLMLTCSGCCKVLIQNQTDVQREVTLLWI